jgi:hypothetical protein
MNDFEELIYLSTLLRLALSTLKLFVCMTNPI